MWHVVDSRVSHTTPAYPEYFAQEEEDHARTFGFFAILTKVLS